MTEAQTDRDLLSWKATYTPGFWLVLAGPNVVVLMPPAPPELSPLLHDLWDDIRQAESIEDVTSRLAAFRATELPNFAVFFWKGAELTSLVRGEVQILDGETAEVIATGEGVQTWSEVGLGHVRRAFCNLQGVDVTQALQLPLLEGVVAASAVVLDVERPEVRLPSSADLDPAVAGDQDAEVQQLPTAASVEGIGGRPKPAAAAAATDQDAPEVAHKDGEATPAEVAGQTGDRTESDQGAVVAGDAEAAEDQGDTDAGQSEMAHGPAEGAEADENLTDEPAGGDAADGVADGGAAEGEADATADDADAADVAAADEDESTADTEEPGAEAKPKKTAAQVQAEVASLWGAPVAAAGAGVAVAAAAGGSDDDDAEGERADDAGTRDEAEASAEDAGDADEGVEAGAAHSGATEGGADEAVTGPDPEGASAQPDDESDATDSDATDSDAAESDATDSDATESDSAAGEADRSEDGDSAAEESESGEEPEEPAKPKKTAAQVQAEVASLWGAPAPEVEETVAETSEAGEPSENAGGPSDSTESSEAGQATDEDASGVLAVDGAADQAEETDGAQTDSAQTDSSDQPADAGVPADDTEEFAAVVVDETPIATNVDLGQDADNEPESDPADEIPAAEPAETSDDVDTRPFQHSEFSNGRPVAPPPSAAAPATGPTGEGQSTDAEVAPRRSRGNAAESENPARRAEPWQQGEGHPGQPAGSPNPAWGASPAPWGGQQQPQQGRPGGWGQGQQFGQGQQQGAPGQPDGWGQRPGQNQGQNWQQGPGQQGPGHQGSGQVGQRPQQAQWGQAGTGQAGAGQAPQWGQQRGPQPWGQSNQNPQPPSQQQGWGQRQQQQQQPAWGQQQGQQGWGQRGPGQAPQWGQQGGPQQWGNQNQNQNQGSWGQNPQQPQQPQPGQSAPWGQQQPQGQQAQGQQAQQGQTQQSSDDQEAPRRDPFAPPAEQASGWPGQQASGGGLIQGVPFGGPAEAAAQDEDDEDDDHDGETIFTTGLAAAQKPQASDHVDEGLVMAVMCSLQHPNPPDADECARCGGPVEKFSPRLVERPVLAKLQVSTGQELALESTVLVGRAPSGSAGETTLTVPSPGHDISRTHLKISLDGWDVVATDLHSTNGTALKTRDGDEPLIAGQPMPLPIGSVLDLGDDVTITVAKAD
ncbi:FHA domain-containing protein [Parenemella sanctibonifatiensis]|nr:FHA domain-containing protein [Parenemella sanctibonifatiensis]